MPQMAPILWVPLFLSMIFLCSLVQSSIYFQANLKTSSPDSAQQSLLLNYVWLW